MPPKKSTALTTPPSSGLAAPSYIKAGDTRGTENIRQQDLKMPFLMIAEKTSPAVEKGYVGIGHLYVNVSKEDLGEEAEFLVVSQMVKREYRESYSDGGAKLCESTDLQHGQGEGGKDKGGKATHDCTLCTLKDWGKDNKGKVLPPACSEVGWWLVQLKGKKDLVVLSLSGTRFTGHRTLSSLISTLKSQQLPGFAKYVRMSLTKKEQGKNTWHMPNFELGDYAGEQDYAAASQAFEAMGKGFREVKIADAE